MKFTCKFQRKSSLNLVCQSLWMGVHHGTVARIGSGCQRGTPTADDTTAVIRAVAGLTCARDGQIRAHGKRSSPTVSWKSLRWPPPPVSLFSSLRLKRMCSPVTAASRLCAACPNLSTASPWLPVPVPSSTGRLPRRQTRIHRASFFFISGRQHGSTKLGTTTRGRYKLTVPLAPPCIQAAIAPACIPNLPPESLNLEFPPKSDPRHRETKSTVASRF
jgi:hypothetical protein